MIHYRIRRDGLEFPVAGAEALVRMVNDASLGPGDRVFDPEADGWCEAQDLPALQGAFRSKERRAQARRASQPAAATLRDDPFFRDAPLGAAEDPSPSEEYEVPASQGLRVHVIRARPGGLEDTDEVEREPAPRQRAVIDGGNLRARRTDPPLRSSSATRPDERPLSRVDLPGAARPAPSPVSAAGAGRPGAEVIAFPKSAGASGQLPPFLPPLGTPEQARAALEDPAPYLRAGADAQAAEQGPRGLAVRPALIVGTVLLGLLAFFIIASEVQHSSNMRFAEVDSVRRSSEAEGTAATTGPAQDQAGTREAVSTADPRAIYDSLERELRNRMMPGAMAITGEEDLDTALRTELSRLGVLAQDIHAPVLDWVGRRADQPHGVEVKIWYEGREGELDRELASIGLVVGKYAQQYDLDVRAFEVFLRRQDGATRKQVIDSSTARQFYLRRLSMYEFLTGVTGG